MGIQVVIPKRIVLKYPDRHGHVQNEIVTAFFDSQGLELLEEDLYKHTLFEPSSPSKLFLVLDLCCKTIPNVDLSNLDLQIFEVSKQKPFTFRDLGEAGRKQAQPRSLTTGWGTDKRFNQKS
ncbi:hypothetical protein GQ44DRAFT_779924 [Phaeosphaeriaceae sp. PMI808]|nr:hypothetical protein GQ44DRAFT_779924 [Phaeosphaeriaceae sp. PMI808]